MTVLVRRGSMKEGEKSKKGAEGFCALQDKQSSWLRIEVWHDGAEWVGTCASRVTISVFTDPICDLLLGQDLRDAQGCLRVRLTDTIQFVCIERRLCCLGLKELVYKGPTMLYKLPRWENKCS